jgi:quercetin dioxygenase-like cupin family protein
MKRLVLMSLLALGSLSFAGCATDSTTRESVAVVAGPAALAIELPGIPGDGKPREVRVLLDEPSVKLVSIVLRAGTVLPPHHSKARVTILALQGGGTLIVGEERLRLDATRAVALAPGVGHAVEPDAGQDLVLLIHHLGPR